MNPWEAIAAARDAVLEAPPSADAAYLHARLTEAVEAGASACTTLSDVNVLPELRPADLAAKCREHGIEISERDITDRIRMAERDLAAAERERTYQVIAAHETDEGPPVEMYGDAWEAESTTAIVEPPKPTPTWPTFAERALRLGLRGGARLPTGFATLDRATRGGLRAGRLVVIVGAPTAGKTSTVVQLARHYHAAGCYVGVHASDEDADGLQMRWGQACGLRREDLEDGTEGDEPRAYLAAQVPDDRVLLVDQEESDVRLDATIARLVEVSAGRPAVLIVDSIQTATCDAHALTESDSPRTRIDLVVAALKRAARTHNLLVVATSEMARGGYRGGSAPPIDALASAKESSSIEYGAAVVLALTSVQGEHGIVKVEVPKNRLGTKTPFRLRWDPDRATFTEVDAPPDATAEDREAVAEARVVDVAENLLRALAQSSTPIIGQRALRSLVPGRGATKAEAVAWLLARGRITGGGREPYRVAGGSS